MRKILPLAFLVLTILTIGCKKQSTENVSIEIMVPASEYDSLGYYLSHENLTAYGSWEFSREYFDSTGNMQLSIHTDSISWLFFTFFPNKYRGSEYKSLNRLFLLVQPGEQYSITFDTTYPMLFRISGDNQEEQDLFNRLSHTMVHTGFRWTENSDTTLTQFVKHLEDSISGSMKPFNDLISSKGMDQRFYNTVYNQVKYSHACGLLSHINIRLRYSKSFSCYTSNQDIHPLSISQDSLTRLREIVFNIYPVSKKQAGLVPNLGMYIEKYLEYKNKDSNINMASYAGRLELVNTASTYLEDDLAELVFANQFHSAFSKQGPDSLATFLFVEFKNRYPDSPFMPGVVSSIEGLTGYYAAFYSGLSRPQVLDDTFDEGPMQLFTPEIRFIAYKEPITEWDSIIGLFKGKNLYVDFWASWCPPCRYEFRFADTLHHFLKQNDIQMLYISTDEDEAKWKNTIAQYNLEGYHYRVNNPDLRSELLSVIHFLPTYMIIDSTGSILEFNAERPHTQKKLFEQLSNAFK